MSGPKAFRIDKSDPQRIEELAELPRLRAYVKGAKASDRLILEDVIGSTGGALAEVTIRLGPPASFGWLRRRELDCGGGCHEAYERPDGVLMYFDRGRPAVAICMTASKGGMT